MRVALFVHCFFPDHFYGTETYTLQLAQALQTRGHEVTVVTAIFQGEPKQASVISRYEYAGVPVLAIDKNYEPHSRIAETYWQEAMRPHIKQILTELRPQIVHVTHLLNHTAVLLEEVEAAGIPMVATLTDFFGFCYNNKLEGANGGLCPGPNLLRTNCIACHLRAVKRDSSAVHRLGYHSQGLLYRISTAFGRSPTPAIAEVTSDIVARPGILKRAYDSYAAMIAPTEFLRNAYIANGFDPKRLYLRRFGVDLSREYEIGVPRSSPLVVGYIGQIAPHKGVDLLLSAARSLPPGRVSLQIYGPANQDPAYMTHLQEIAPSDTEFRGTFPPTQLARTLSQFDVLAIPSTWYENSPLVLLNALACHTPVLVSDVQGLTEFVTEGQNGWSFRRADMADLRRVLSELAADPEVVRNAAKTTHYELTTQAMGDAVATLYAEVLDSRSVRRRQRDT
jgi:glycosyltransferase involved in cell wall biosynthesis